MGARLRGAGEWGAAEARAEDFPAGSRPRGHSGDTPGVPWVKTMLPTRGAWGGSLAGKRRPCMPLRAANKKKRGLDKRGTVGNQSRLQRTPSEEPSSSELNSATYTPRVGKCLPSTYYVRAVCWEPARSAALDTTGEPSLCPGGADASQKSQQIRISSSKESTKEGREEWEAGWVTEEGLSGAGSEAR